MEKITLYFIAWSDIASPSSDFYYAEVQDFSTLEIAQKHAEDRILETAESYGGLHGTPYYGTCQECDGLQGEEEDCEECEGTGEIGWEKFRERVENETNYTAEIYDPIKHNSILENIGESIPEVT